MKYIKEIFVFILCSIVLDILMYATMTLIRYMPWEIGFFLVLLVVYPFSSTFLMFKVVEMFFHSSKKDLYRRMVWYNFILFMPNIIMSANNMHTNIYRDYNFVLWLIFLYLYNREKIKEGQPSIFSVQ